MILPLRWLPLTRISAPVPVAPQKDPATALALFQAWDALCTNPTTVGTAEEHAAYLAVTLYDVAHLTGNVARPFPTTRPEARPMTVDTFQPLAQYEFGARQTKGGQTSGYSAGYVTLTAPGTPAGAACVMWRTPAMLAPAFDYYATLQQAQTAYLSNRARAQQLHTPAHAAPSLTDFLIAEGLSADRAAALAQHARTVR